MDQKEIPDLFKHTPEVTLEQRYTGTNVTEEDIAKQNAFESGIVEGWAETVVQNLKVSSEAFFEIIEENIKDFEMEPKEAVLDAIQQLKSQGVDERVLRHYLEHDMSAYRDVDLGDDSSKAENAADSDNNAAAAEAGTEAVPVSEPANGDAASEDEDADLAD